MVCDTPGFEDSRRIEIDIANAIGITSALLGCKSVRPLLLISFREIQADRGKPIRSTLRLMTRMVTNLEDTMKNMNVAFTHVDPGVTFE